MMAEPYLAPHPWDALGKPPAPGKAYVEPEKVAPKADHDGFTDATGKHIDYEAGVAAAAEAILDQGDHTYIEDLIRDYLSPDDILEWIVYPDTGEFADDVR